MTDPAVVLRVIQNLLKSKPSPTQRRALFTMARTADLLTERNRVKRGVKDHIPGPDRVITGNSMGVTDGKGTKAGARSDLPDLIEPTGP